MRGCATPANAILPIDSAHPQERDLDASALTATVARAQSGDEKAMATLIELYQSRVAGYVFRLLGEAGAVDDLCQTIFLRVCGSLRDLRAAARFEPWLFRIARNTRYQHRRNERFRRLLTPLASIHEGVPTAEIPPLTGELAAVQEALQRLSRRDRELLALCSQEYSYERMRDITGLTLAALKTRIFRARQALRRLLNRE